MTFMLKPFNFLGLIESEVMTIRLLKLKIFKRVPSATIKCQCLGMKS